VSVIYGQIKKKLWKKSTMIEPLSKDELHSKLSSTSGQLHSAFWGKSRVAVNHRSSNPEYGKYTPLEALVILQHAAEIFADRVQRMVSGENVPETRDFNPDMFLSKVDIEDESVKANLREFMDARAKLFRSLFPLKDEEEWDKFKIVHEVYGEITLRQLLTTHLQMEQELTKNAVAILKDYYLEHH